MCESLLNYDNVIGVRLRVNPVDFCNSGIIIDIMISDLALRIGRYLPKPLKQQFRPMFYILNDTEKYTKYAINKMRKDRIIDTKDGFKMVIDTSDFVQRRYITDEGKGEESINEVMREKIKGINDGDFIDVGANVGFYPLMFCQYNEGTAYSFEPLSYNIQRFDKNMELNGFDNYNLFEIGLSDHRHESKIYYHAYNKGAGGEMSGESGIDLFLQSEKVSFDTLDNIQLQSNDISLMKIDVEGHEQDVIKGAEQTIRREMPEILVEIHPTRLKQNGQSLESFLSTLFEIGYDSVYLIESGITLGKSEAMESLERVEDNHGILFTP